jgi:hypothetical protein
MEAVEAAYPATEATRAAALERLGSLQGVIGAGGFAALRAVLEAAVF